MNNNDDSLTTRLGQALEASGLTRKGLARRMGASPAVVSRWFRGDRAPSPGDSGALAVAMGVCDDWLANGTGPMRAAGQAAEGADLAEAAFWDFRPAPRDGGRDFGNSNVWSFDPGLDVFVREVLQNAQDAATAADGRVGVTFRLIRLRGADKRAYLQALRWEALRGHLEAAAAGGQKIGTLLRDGLGRIDDQDLLLLVVDDRGTVGLTGSERGTGHFAALCRDNLHSTKDLTAGGAFGLGKAVLWRAFAAGHRPVRLAAVGVRRAATRATGSSAAASWPGTSMRRPSTPGPAGSGGAPPRSSAPSRSGTTTGWPAPFTSTVKRAGRRCAWSVSTTLRRIANATPRSSPASWPGPRPSTSSRAMVAGRLAVRVEASDGRQSYDRLRPSFAEDVDPDQYVPTYARMLRAYRDGATVGQLGDDGEVACREVTLAVPARTAAPGHGEQTHRAVLLVAAAGEEAREARPAGKVQPPGRSPRPGHDRAANLAAGGLPGDPPGPRLAALRPGAGAGGRRGQARVPGRRRGRAVPPGRPSRRRTTRGPGRRTSGRPTPGVACRG